jgi:hypothetical protein
MASRSACSGSAAVQSSDVCSKLTDTNRLQNSHRKADYGDLFSGRYPRIRTSADKYAISDTDRTVIIETIKQLHTELGCKAKLEAPCTFLQHIGTVLDFFEEQHASGKWTKSTLAGKTVHVLQFLEMTSQFNLKQEYHAVFTTLLESLAEDAPRQTLKPEFVDTLHANIKKLTEDAMQELKCVDNFEFKYYMDGSPFQCVMDSICLLYLWGTNVDNSNDRRVLQTFTYKSIDTDESHDNYLYEENGHMFLRLNHLTKVFKTFQPHTINLSETNAPLADILKQWKPVAEKYQSGKTFEVYLRTRKVTKYTPTPDRSNPYVLFQYFPQPTQKISLLVNCHTTVFPDCCPRIVWIYYRCTVVDSPDTTGKG